MEWEDEFKRRVLNCLIRGGTPVSARASEYGWEEWDEEVQAHALECGWNPAASGWRDSAWTEFQGTFAEEPYWSRTGIDATITCNCTLLEDQVFRYTAGHAALLRYITGDRGEVE
jgi:hypothetical protein